MTNPNHLEETVRPANIVAGIANMVNDFSKRPYLDTDLRVLFSVAGKLSKRHGLISKDTLENLHSLYSDTRAYHISTGAL